MPNVRWVGYAGFLFPTRAESVSAEWAMSLLAGVAAGIQMNLSHAGLVVVLVIAADYARSPLTNKPSGANSAVHGRNSAQRIKMTWV